MARPLRGGGPRPAGGAVRAARTHNAARGGRVDLLVHAAAFAAVAWTGRCAGVPTLPLLVLLVLHAPLSGVMQASLLPHRSGDPVDVLADLAGVGIGALLPVPGVASRRRVKMGE